jgi:hypothetical protein
MDGTVQRLNRRMGKEWHFVGCVIALAKIEYLGDIPDRFCNHTITFAGRAKMVPYVLRTNVGPTYDPQQRRPDRLSL